MTRSDLYNLREDEEFVYVPEEFFNLLPKEYREAAEARKQQGKKVLRIADNDIKGLIRLARAIPTTSSLSYIYHRLKTAKFEVTAEALLEQEVLTTAFIVTYARLFASGNGAVKLSKTDIPEHLRPVHQDIMDLRHQRYAHNGTHKTINSGIELHFDDDGFKVSMQMRLGFFLGGRNEWEELITFIDAHMHESLMKILRRLERKTGYEWTFPEGPRPDWVGNYG
ncbi:hypothetical protein [Sulfitobacter sp. CW3]|uniref:hypothetical protein n=1 Tax=Sulfitobacter sp. CW3 TaxID=2861965 RepID=UPI001C60125E|nr:hypothetical protein [Sulfitobacter sp. CW3]MBW4962945.1 hypothetical protein [Sulfitobacter sp. CW3]